MKNLINEYELDGMDDETFERFGRKGKLPQKEGTRPRRNAAQESIKQKRREREGERERAEKDVDSPIRI